MQMRFELSVNVCLGLLTIAFVSNLQLPGGSIYVLVAQSLPDLAWFRQAVCP